MGHGRFIDRFQQAGAKRGMNLVGRVHYLPGNIVLVHVFFFASFAPSRETINFSQRRKVRQAFFPFFAFFAPLRETKSGGVLLSHAVARVVSSARQGLTSEFGMGSGVTPSVHPFSMSWAKASSTMAILSTFFASSASSRPPSNTSKAAFFKAKSKASSRTSFNSSGLA